MALRYFQALVFLVVSLVPQHEAVSRPPSPISIHFDSDGQIFSKRGPINYVRPVYIGGTTDKLSSLLKKSKFLVGKLPDWRGIGDVEKTLPSLLDSFRPVPIFNSQGPELPPQFDDVKPVTEHIEDDLKYDFRTKVHSF